jgi:hypothetical protein
MTFILKALRICGLKRKFWFKDFSFTLFAYFPHRKKQGINTVILSSMFPIYNSVGIHKEVLKGRKGRKETYYFYYLPYFG